MFLSRKIGALFRGRATRVQIVVGAVLGMLLAFVPGFAFPDGSGGGFSQAPGLILFLVALALVLDANVAVLGLTLVIGKLLSIPLLPVSFSVGEALLGTGADGSGLLEGLFRALVQSPATAWFGFQYYSVTGGAVLGLVLGVVAGLIWWKLIDSTRRRLEALDEGSERWQTITRKPLVRFLAWAFLGKGKGRKQSWEEVNERAHKRKHPIRFTGLAVVVVLFAGIGFAHDYFGGSWFEKTARVGMTQWNGATADLGSARLDLLDARLTMNDLALADERDLDTDSFRAKNLDFDLSTGALLERRVVVDRLAITQAEAGTRRERPGVRLGDEDPTTEEPGGESTDGSGTTDPTAEGPESSTRDLEELLEDVDLWRERLATAQTWIDRLFGESSDESTQENEAQAELFGLATVVAKHLLDQEPGFLVKDLRIEDMTCGAFGGLRWDLTGSNLSSDPGLVPEPARLSITSEDGRNRIDLQRDADGRIGLDLDLADLPIAVLKEQMPWLPLEGGSLRFGLAGDFGVRDGRLSLDLPLRIEVRDTTMTIGSASTRLEALEIPASVHGPMTAPNFRVDADELLRRLQAAGAEALVQGLASEFGVPSEALDAVLRGEIDSDSLLRTGENLLDESGAVQDTVNEAQRRAEEAARGLRGLLPGGGGRDRRR